MSSTADTPLPLDDAPLDEAAFAALYAEHRDALRRFIVSKTRNRGQAEDLMQEVFAKAFAGRGRFDTSRPFWPWLVAIATRECIDAHRRRTYSEKRTALLLHWTRDEAVQDASTTVLAAAERRHLAAQLDRLPPRQRAVLELVAMDEWSYADVADHLGYSVPTVKSLVLRARRHLREVAAGALGAWPGLRRRWHRAAAHARVIGLPWLPGVGESAGGVWSVATAPHLAAVVAVTLAVLTSAAAVPADLVVVPGQPMAAAPAPTEEVPTSRAPIGRSGAAAPTAGMERVADEMVASVVADSSREVGPDDTTVSHFEASQGYERDHTVFMVGTAGVDTPLLSGPMFVSRDGGASWARRRALGLGSVHRLLLPPSYPADPRVFALTARGLQVSVDDGDSFTTLAPLPQVGATYAVGLPSAAALSPGFHAGDPTIVLAAAGRLWRYHVDTARLEGLELGPRFTGHQVVAVAFADGVLLVGTMATDPADRLANLHYVSRCTVAAMTADCTRVQLPSPRQARDLRLRVPSSSEGVVYVPFSFGPTVSLDGARTFRRVDLDAEQSLRITDLVTVPGTAGRSALATLADAYPLVRTEDAGATWTAVPLKLPGSVGAARVVVTPTGRIIVARRTAGMECSEDGGRTWAPLCPTPDG